MLFLFDLDGTLIDSQRGILASIAHALTGMGEAVPPDATLRDWIGPPLRVSFPAVLGPDPARTEQAVERYRQRYRASGWREHEVYPGIAGAITALHAAGHTLAVVTAKPQDQAERIVSHLPFGACFARIYGAHPDSADHGKAGKIAQALREMGGRPDDTCMIGDRRYDMEGAVANRVRAIGVSWGFGSLDELRDAGASLIIEHADRLRPLGATSTVA